MAAPHDKAALQHSTASPHAFFDPLELEFFNASNSSGATVEPSGTEVFVGSVIATIVSCSLSIIGALTIIFTFIFFKEIRTTSRGLLVFLSIADLITAASLLYGIIGNFQENCLACQIQSAFVCFGQTSSFFWTTSVTVYLYLTIVKADITLAGKLQRYFHAFSWGLPLAIVIIAGSLDGLGYDSSNTSVRWCWVYLENPHYVFWMLFTCKFWEFVAYIIIPLLCILMKVHIYKQRRRRRPSTLMIQTDTMEALVRINRKLLFIPTVFILLRIWGTLRFILYLADSPVVSDPTLVTLHGIGNSFQGGANCILYCLLTTKIQQKLKESFLYLFKCVPCRNTSADPNDSPWDRNKSKCSPCSPCCLRKKTFVHVKSLDYYDKLGAGESTKLLDH
ncbi:G-protein coupled receptor 157-like [Lineus longissimus]|uniref:G-protein coupled receptor 157-like n=1 Tax=Lineus longissimus TaxID=88925 RepID=UPI002B4C5FDF